jgi:hypothetical protein
LRTKNNFSNNLLFIMSIEAEKQTTKTKGDF